MLTKEIEYEEEDLGACPGPLRCVIHCEGELAVDLLPQCCPGEVVEWCVSQHAHDVYAIACGDVFTRGHGLDEII